MKHLTSIVALTLLLLTSTESMAQKEWNVIYRCAKGDITYTEPQKEKKSTAKTVGSILGSVLEMAAGDATTVDNHPEYANAVRDAIAAAIGDARRIQLIDGKFLPGEIDGDEHVIYYTGSISSISTTQRTHTWEDKDKKTHSEQQYKGNITAQINIKDAHTDAIVKSLSINSSSYTDEWVATADKALGNTINRMKNYITNSMNYAFPLFASIVEAATAKKDKQKEVYIDLGSPDGVWAGMHFVVYEIKTVAGKEARKEIGRLKINEVMGDDISLCKVQKGGKDIKAAIDEGKTLRIQSTD